MGDFGDSFWADERFSKTFLEKADIYVLERWRLFRIVSSYFEHFFRGRRGISLLDLGCGDGVLTEELLKIDETIEATLVDGSESMLARAARRLSRRPMWFSKDRSAAVNVSDPFMVTRVIEYGATPVSPAPGNGDTTSGTPVLKWTPPSVTFSYTYTLSISRIDAGTPTAVWETANLSSVYEEYPYPTDGSVAPLPAGNYVWAITVVDEFGNSCRSKESAFVVQ